MSSVYDVLKERGFIAQCTYEDDLKKKLENEKVTFYVGFDPTADSLHIGHYIPIMAMAHMQKFGHRPIALVGGGTAMIGDPSGKTDMRRMMTRQTVADNAAAIKKQLGRFISFEDDKAIMVDNGDWLLGLNYVEFIRDIGAHFSVNRMLTAECYKQRLERGLTFLEFNYMLMQSYDFLMLNQKYGCTVEMGGDDQWSNMLSGADLIRRKEQKDAFAMTFKLLLTHDGKKMGKTVAGALWLDPKKTSPYDFYQYWRNVDDEDVEKCLALLTFLPMDEVRALGALEGSEKNKAKRVLAYEVTKLVHGEEEAERAQQAAEALFGAGGATANVPTTHISEAQLDEDARVTTWAVNCGLCKSRGEARKTVEGGGLYIGDEKVQDVNQTLTWAQLQNDGILLRRGKKNYHRLVAAQ
ncbi:MAG: tyrosine--tRNA ligase [Candidatus Fimadaptatus sp.]|jgi:tyrosyl-tRNA synthetase